MSKATFFKAFDKDYSERDFDQRETMKWLTRYKNLPMCWGFRNPRIIKKSGLLFTVNGLIHKGHVLITLAGNDTYTIRLLNSQYNVVGAPHEHIYCDMLCEYVDQIVETKTN